MNIIIQQLKLEHSLLLKTTRNAFVFFSNKVKICRVKVNCKFLQHTQVKFTFFPRTQCRATMGPRNSCECSVSGVISKF